MGFGNQEPPPTPPVVRRTLPVFPSAPDVPSAPFPERRFRAGGLEIRPLAGPSIPIPKTEDEDFLRRFAAWFAQTAGSLPEYIVWEFLTLRKKQIPGVDFCPTPEQRILTWDLEWIPAGKLKAGDRILGFDEEGPRRQWRPATIVSSRRGSAEVYRVLLSDRTELTATGEHRWITGYTSRNGCNSGHHWIRTADLRPGIPLTRFTPTWETDTSWGAGWLSGFYDGEGSYSFSNAPTKRFGTNLMIAQKPGKSLDQARALLLERGFQLSEHQVIGKAWQTRINGRFAETLRLLGTIRPQRLIDKLHSMIEEKGTGGGLLKWRDPPLVESVTPLGRQEIRRISSSSQTYICEGFGAHNTYQHPLLGGRTEFGGFVLDFLFPFRSAGWRVLGKRFHLLQPEDRARDSIARALLEDRGIEVIDLWDDDLITRADFVLEAAWEGREVVDRRPEAA
ncbi:MAG: hypothetical protein IIC90_08610 [Chloroflexi bacterium]|nr:hypothetical protein [Chloroflexota bacterium]